MVLHTAGMFAESLVAGRCDDFALQKVMPFGSRPSLDSLHMFAAIYAFRLSQASEHSPVRGYAIITDARRGPMSRQWPCSSPAAKAQQRRPHLTSKFIYRPGRIQWLGSEVGAAW